MNHERYQDLLLDHASGRLADDHVVELELHLAQCEECRQSLALYRTLVNARGSDPPLFSGHPGPDELIRFATDDNSLDSDNRAVIAAHVRECESCQEEIEFVREAEAEGIPKVLPMSTRIRTPRIPDWVTYAAAAAILLMVYPAYRGLVDSDVAEQSSNWLAPPAMIELGEPIAMRSGVPRGATSPVPEYRIGPDREYVQLLFGSDALTSGTAPGDRLTLSLHTEPDGRRIWEATLGRDHIYEPRFDLFAVVLSSSIVDGGTYRLAIRQAHADDSIVEYTFELVR